MKKILNCLLVFILCFLFLGKAEAKWWIFGKGNDEVNINYLYINKISYDETVNKLILNKDSLPNGMITVAGKASVKKGKIGTVFVSTDGKQTWERAKLSANGSFEYVFTPKLNHEYDVYIQAMDTTRKTNDIEATHRKITVINEDIGQIIREIFDKIVKAYENEDKQSFMAYVSNDFSGDVSVLDSALRKDFNAFDYIKLNYIINNVSRDGRGNVFVALQYNRNVASAKDGKSFSDKGNTEIIFKNENGTYKILTMKNPLLFGLSDAENVASGTVTSTDKGPIILVDDSGNVTQKPFEEGIETIVSGGNPADDSDILTGNGILLHSTHIPGRGLCIMGFLFEDEMVSEAPDDNDISLLHRGDGDDVVLIKASNGIMEVSDWNTAEVPESGYNSSIIGSIYAGKIYALKINNGTKYALIKITRYTSAGTDGEVQFDYKYQPNGTRKF